jgi:hypothetical protein
MKLDWNIWRIYGKEGTIRWEALPSTEKPVSGAEVSELRAQLYSVGKDTAERVMELLR